MADTDFRPQTADRRNGGMAGAGAESLATRWAGLSRARSVWRGMSVAVTG